MSRIFRIAEMFHQQDSDKTDDLTLALDLGGPGAVPVTHGYVAMTVDGADAYTLANGKPGQILVINCVVQSVGTATLTPATATGFSTIAFADAGDYVVLFYIDDVIGWIILSTFGLTAQPTVGA